MGLGFTGVGQEVGNLILLWINGQFESRIRPCLLAKKNVLSLFNRRNRFIAFLSQAWLSLFDQSSGACGVEGVVRLN